MNWTPKITDTLDEALELAGEPVVQAVLLVLVGLIAGYLIGRTTIRLLNVVGLPGLVEGTGTERWLQRMGTSTERFIGRLVSLFIYVGAILWGMLILGVLESNVFLPLATAWLPHLFIAILVLVVGVVVADAAEILTSERLQGIKLPEVTVIPAIVKYTILFIAGLIALGQVGVDTTALLVLLTVYFLGLVLLGVVALQDFLASGAAGIYLLLNEPYTIGDEVAFEEAAGIVQEVDVFTTKIESEGVEYVIPNRRLIREGVRRSRD